MGNHASSKWNRRMKYPTWFPGSFHVTLCTYIWHRIIEGVSKWVLWAYSHSKECRGYEISLFYTPESWCIYVVFSKDPSFKIFRSCVYLLQVILWPEISYKGTSYRLSIFLLASLTSLLVYSSSGLASGQIVGFLSLE